MSRHNKDRKRARKADRGYCAAARCGASMDVSVYRAAKAKIDATAARLGRPAGRIVNLCGTCRAKHYFEGGRFRLLTLTEEFEVNMRCEEAIAVSDVLADPPTGGGSLILQSGQSVAAFQLVR